MSPDATPAAEVAALRKGDLPAPQHAALRRITALVAAGAPARELFGAVLREIMDVLALPRGWLFRYEAGPAMAVLASANCPQFPEGSRWPLDGTGVAATIRDTGRPARLDAVCGVPIFVDGGIWGGIGVGTEDRLLPADTTERLGAITELVAGVISSAATRDRLATLADHQTSLRRVATLVAEETPAAELFAAVTVEATRVLAVPAMVVSRYEGGTHLVVVASRNARRFTVGSRWALDEPGVAPRVHATGRPARIDDYSGLSGRLAAGVRDSGLGSIVGVPIMVEGRIWGVGCAGTRVTEALPAGIEDRLRDFTDLVGIAIANAESRQRPRRLAEEQAALRRVATLVAEGAAPAAVFMAVAREVAHILDVATVTVVRFESDETSVVVASHKDAGFPVGSRWPLDGPSLSAMVFQSGLPARLDDHEGLPGPVAAAARASGVRAGVAVPITVDGRVWGMIAVGLRPPRATLPAHAGMLSSRLVLSAASAQEMEQRLAAFTELVATAISKAQVHDDLRSLADEQAALRRVATLIARDVPPSELFGAVSSEVGVLLGADLGGMIRYEGDGTVTAVAKWAAVGEHPPVPERWQIEPGDPAWLILESRAATRVEDWESVPGPFAEAVRNSFGVSSSVGCPIVVEGRLWGALAVHSKQRRPLPADTESRIAQFTDLVGTAIANAESRARADRLTEEQVALRRVATLVAQEAPLETVFAKVAEEVARTLDSVDSALWRDDGDGTAIAVAVRGPNGAAGVRVGTRLSLEGDSVITAALREGRPHRIDDYSRLAGSIAARARELGMRSAVGCPIVVGSRTWGVMTVATFGAEPLTPETETRVARFSELVAMAIANSEARAEVERLAEEQAALRRVATLVAEGVEPAALFSAVTQEVARLFADVSRSLVPSVIRFDPGPEFVLVGAAKPMLDLPLGSRWGSKDLYVSTRVLRSGCSARVDAADVAELGGPDADLLRRQGFLHQVGSPIVVEDRLWGAMTINSGEPLPPDAGDRLEKFTELVATAIANAESRGGLRRLADEQAVLRRVATLVARGFGPDPVFRAVVEAAEARFGADISAIVRFDADGKVRVMGAHGGPHEPGARVELDPRYVVAAVRETGIAARFDCDDPSDANAPDFVRELRIRSGLASPIVVDGDLWGAITLASLDRPLPAGTDRRLADFTELMATAVSNTQAREDLQRLVEEQAALRRVATLIARGTPSDVLFSAVCDEVEALAGADGSVVLRFEAEDTATVMGIHAGHHPVGARVELDPDFVVGEVQRTGRAARFDTDDPAAPDMPEVVREARIRSAVASPIVVEGELWGAITTASRERPLAAGMERRLADFTELVATAVSNLQARAEVAASRARIVAAADGERRRVVRDLHDGAQQRLVHTIVTLKLAKRALEDDGAEAGSLVDEALEQAQRGNTELRELAHGILPSALTRGGLRAGVHSVLERLDLPVDVDVPADRFPSEIEASAYFIVAEALTNVAKHSHAGRAEVTASLDDRTLRIEVRDDGAGGADPDGHGLVGMRDRATTLGGRLEIDSPAGGGTLVAATLPLSAG